MLRAAGVDVQLCADSHLCCGSAGTYSVLQPELSYQLRDDKLTKLQATAAGDDRLGQYRLPDAFAVRHRDAGHALDRTDRQRAGARLNLACSYRSNASR